MHVVALALGLEAGALRFLIRHMDAQFRPAPAIDGQAEYISGEKHPASQIAPSLAHAPLGQIQRILRRDGPEAAERFRTVWIPLEEAYFNGYRVRETCEINVNCEK